MCVSCVKERCPDRGKTCLDGGTYLLNYKMCSQCNKKSPLEEKELTREEIGNEETVTYQHICQDCGHVIASHEYSFSYDDESQDYSMECDLCGHGMDTVNIIPDDNF